MSKLCYRLPYPPGTPLEGGHLPAPLPDDWNGAIDEAAFVNFGVVACRIESVDVLHLRATGHERWILRWQPDGNLEEQIVAP